MDIPNTTELKLRIAKLEQMLRDIEVSATGIRTKMEPFTHELSVLQNEKKNISSEVTNLKWELHEAQQINE